MMVGLISLLPSQMSINNTYYNFTDFGSNNSGYYTLQAVLTHQGR